MHLTIDTPERMAALGALIAAQLRAGDLLTLNGELGHPLRGVDGEVHQLYRRFTRLPMRVTIS